MGGALIVSVCDSKEGTCRLNENLTAAAQTPVLHAEHSHGGGGWGGGFIFGQALSSYFKAIFAARRCRPPVSVATATAAPTAPTVTLT